MENQHRKIKGYSEFSQKQIDLMNVVKEQGVTLDELIDRINAVIKAQYEEATELEGPARQEELARLDLANPSKWSNIAKDHFQQGLMALTRAVAQPGFF